MRSDDIAGKALEQSQLQGISWMLRARIKRGDTLKLDGLNGKLLLVLRERCHELELATLKKPDSVDDWMALALFTDDRQAFVALCQQAVEENDPNFRQAEYWLTNIIKN